MGSGFKNFTAGSVLTASDVNNYLMEQSVMSFSTLAARDAAITAPEAGMVVFITSATANRGLWGYDGSTWLFMAPASATPLHAARVQQTTTTAIPATTWTTLANWTTESYDYNNNMVPSTGIFTTTVAGLYDITAHVTVLGNNNPQAVGIAIAKNGAVVSTSQISDAGAAAGAVYRVVIADCLDLAAGDNIRIQVWNGGGNAVNTENSGSASHFAIRKVPC